MTHNETAIKFQVRTSTQVACGTISDDPRLGSGGYKLPPREFTSYNCNVLFHLYVRKFYNDGMGNDKAGNNDRTTHNIPPVYKP